MVLPKAYDPSATEDSIYALWEQSGAFQIDVKSKKEPFTISMPPPNATGQLHLGHAVMLALEDIFIRFNRMRGKEALWVPGTDHAAIATESVVIRKIQEEEHIPDPRAKLGREEVLRRIRDFVAKSQGIIRSQVRKMGASCDWSRERYTMDASLSRCVNEVFKKMYEDGLIYRGHRIVNWDPKMQTTVSDDEIEYIEEKVPFYTFQYGPFQIGTARPETKFGDKYVVMHPDDERYKEFGHGQQFECEWINGRVTATVIKDKAIDPEFGTGVMTITPWHDHADFEIAEHHHLDKEQIIDFQGRLLPVAGEFAGMPIEEARPKIAQKLKEKGLLVKVDEEYVHRIAVSYRGKGKVEPQIKEQWFIDVHKPVVQWKKKKLSLKRVMQDVIKSGDIEIIPERFEKVYFHWIDNLRDWCISRQIWWGHRVPVYYCDACRGAAESAESRQPSHRLCSGQAAVSFQYASVQSISTCPKCGGPVTQDPDTLDTWFSSGLWTWSTLVDPALAEDYSLSLKDLLKKSPEFKKFHPTTVMETGYDILFFWVARMILMTTYATGQIPFEKVYLHGLVRTRDGKKMSKSDPETCIDPLEMIAEFGADALRMSMIVGQSPGNDFRLYREKIAGYRNFINKLWNASRFVLIACDKAGFELHSSAETLHVSRCTLADKALLSALQELIADVTKGLEEYRLSEVGERLYSFIWDYFCDWYLELSKGDPSVPDGLRGASSNPAVLVHALRTIVRLLHPYCPFVTEELWKHIKPEGSGMLMGEPWPEAKKSLKDQHAFGQLQVVIDVVSAIRSMRADHGIERGKKVPVVVHAKKLVKLIESQRSHIMRLGDLSELTIDAKPRSHRHAASMFLKGMEVHLPLEGVIDLAAEKAKLEKERGNLADFVASIEQKLSNKQFTQHAPVAVVENERQKLKDNQEKLRKIDERLNEL